MRDMEIKQIKSKFLGGSFDQNTYVCINENEAVLIDAGADILDIKKAVGKRKVFAVLMTHLHFDHLWNIEKIIAEFDCDIYMKEGEENRLENASKNASFLIGENMAFEVPKNHIKYYAEKLEIGDFEFEIFNSYGHTDDSVCIKLGDSLFTGDTVFADGFGRTDLIDGNADKMLQSLKMILNLNYKMAYPGHFGSASKKQIDKQIKMCI